MHVFLLLQTSPTSSRKPHQREKMILLYRTPVNAAPGGRMLYQVSCIFMQRLPTELGREKKKKITG